MATANKGDAGVAGPGGGVQDSTLLERKSVLMGMAASMGLVFATAAQPTAAAGTVKPSPIAATQPAYVPRWTPNTAYVRGQQVISPVNDVVSATEAHISSTTYTTDTARWNLSPTYAPADSTDETTIIYVKPTGSDAASGLSWKKAKATIQAAIDAVPAGGGIVRMAGSSFQLAAPIAVDARLNLTIEGTGPNATQIVVNGNYDALSFTGVCARITVRNLWIGSFANRTAGYGIKIVGTTGVHSDSFCIENVVVQNTFGGLYSQNLDASYVSRFRVKQSVVGAMVDNGIHLLRTISTHLRDCAVSATAGTIGGAAVLIDSDCDTITCDGFDVGQAYCGFSLANNLGGTCTGPRLIRLTNCYSESNTSNGFVITAGRDVRLSGCHSAVNGGAGFAILGGDSINLDNWVALSNALHGVAVTAGTGVKIVNGAASNNSDSIVKSCDGINVGSGVSHLRLIGNRCGDFIFTNQTQRYGISLATVTDYLVVALNDTVTNFTAGLLNSSNGTHNAIANNI